MPIRIEEFEDGPAFRRQFYPLLALLAMIRVDLQRIAARASEPPGLSRRMPR
jgi:hypothetical protein